MRAIALLFVLLVAASGQSVSDHTAQKSALWKMSRDYVDARLNNVSQSDALRRAELEQIFRDLRCQGPRFREEEFPDGQNLICTLPGTAPAMLPPVKSGIPPVANPEFGTIVFLAHYEHEGSGQGAVDNWSGSIMLPFLYHALEAGKRYHTFLFAAVDGEAGAKALFSSLSPQQRHAIKGVVALDALGLGPAQFYVNPNDTYSGYATSWLRNQLLQAATDQNFPAPVLAIPGGWFNIDETREFRHNSIPSIVIHSVNWRTRHLPGSAQDTTESIDRDAYFQTVELLDDYVVELDQPWPSAAAGLPSGPSGGRRR